MMFREQIGTISSWFEHWSPCEQTVAMAALFRKLHPIQGRFLTTLLHKQLAECSELRRAEILANDPNFVTSLIEGDLPSIRELLLYLPLLNPKNQDAKNLYLSVIPKVLIYNLNNCAHMEETRQLLSYSLIHPAFTFEEIRNFATMLHQFEDKLKTIPTNGDSLGLGCQFPNLSESPPNLSEFGGSWHQQSSNTPSKNTSGNSVSQSGLSIGNFNGSVCFHKIRRSNSLTPPVLRSDGWNTQDDMCSAKPRSLSLSSELSPQCSLGSSGSGSESRLDDPRPTFVNAGMTDVPNWLKSLRLHKYAFLFAHLTYEEMMHLNEVKLEAQGVTKGARHKIVLSIAKLKERAQHLKKVYEDLVPEKESIRNSLNEVKWTLSTPVKPASLVETNITEGEGTNSGNNKVESISTSTAVSSSNTVVTGNTNTMAPIGTNRYQEDTTKTTGEQLFRSELNSSNQMLGKNDGDGGDFTVWIVLILGKACELNPDMECEGLLVSVLEKCIAHEGFTPKQKRLLTLWRQQQAPITRRNSSGSGHPQFQYRCWSVGSPGGSPSQRGRHFSPRVLNLGNQVGSAGSCPSQASSSWSPSSSYAMFMAKRPSLQDSVLESARSQSHLFVQRTKSAPLPNFFTRLSSSPPSITTHFEQFTSQQISSSNALTGLGGTGTGLPGFSLSHSPPPPIGSLINGTNYGNCGSGSSTSTIDITSRLESLCLSMTEAALGPAFSN